MPQAVPETQRFPGNSDVFKSGALLVNVAEGADMSSEEQRFSIWEVDPGNFTWRPVTGGFHPIAVFAADGKTLYISYGTYGKGEVHPSYLEVFDLTGQQPRRGFAYPRPLGRNVRQLAPSSYGGWLYTMTDGATADFGSPLVIYEFDTKAEAFRTTPTSGPPIDDPLEGFLFPYGEGFGVYDARRHITYTASSRTPDPHYSTTRSPLACSPEDNCDGFEHHTTRSVISTAGPIYIVYKTGNVVTPPGAPGRWIDGVPPRRFLHSPLISSDQKLLLIPTGEDAYFVDRISLYDLHREGVSSGSAYHKVREILLDRPVMQIRPSLDGTSFFAVLEDLSIAVLDGQSLQQKALIGRESRGVYNIQVIPTR